MVKGVVTMNHSKRKFDRHQRNGATLLLCLFTLFIVSSFLLNIYRTETLQLTTTRNLIEYERALYQANAGVHHACAELLQDSSWRGNLSSGTLPPSTYPNGYQITASDSGTGGVTIQSTGYANNGVRTIEATIEL